MAENISRYLQIAQDLEDKINRGIFSVGTVLPTEIELARAYGVSRFTLRAALQELKNLGLVSRKKNVGTQVEAASRSGRFRASPTSLQELAEFGATHLRKVLCVAQVKADAALADELECQAEKDWIRLSIIRLSAEDERLPLGHSDVYVDDRYAGVVKHVEERPDRLTASLIEEIYGCKINLVQQHIYAVAVGKQLAQVLKMENGQPALKIVRRYINEEQEVVTISITFHPADRYHHSTQLHRA